MFFINKIIFYRFIWFIKRYFIYKYLFRWIESSEIWKVNKTIIFKYGYLELKSKKWRNLLKVKYN